jgi:hypothetical protein
MMRLALAVAAIAALTVPASAGFRSYYSASGAYAGSAITRGSYSTFTNGGGRCTNLRGIWPFAFQLVIEVS